MKKKFWKWVKGLVDKHCPEAYELPTKYPNVNWEDNVLRDKIIMEHMQTVSHAMLLYFKTCKLKSHMECMVIDEITDDKFILSFKKFDGTHKAPNNSLKIID